MTRISSLCAERGHESLADRWQFHRQTHPGISKGARRRGAGKRGNTLRSTSNSCLTLRSLHQLTPRTQQICRERNSTAPATHEFLLQGTDKIYAIHVPKSHLKRNRQQLIIEIDMAADAKKAYVEYKTANPVAIVTIKSLEAIAIEPLVYEKRGFEANLEASEDGKSW